MSKQGIQLAVQAAGSQVNLAKTLGVSEAYVSEWVKRGWVAPAYVAQIEQHFGVSRRLTLNPKLIALVDGA